MTGAEPVQKALTVPLRHSTREFGTLQCHVIDALEPGGKPRLGVVLCHGFGAPGTDLLPLAEALFQAQPSLRQQVQFLFPEAPLSLAAMGMPGGRAWWELSVQRLQAQLQSGRFEEIRQACPAGLVEARLALRAAVQEWSGETGLSLAQVVFGGFSQGAMLSVETVAHLESPPAGLVILSGMLIHEPAWKQGLAAKPRLPVFQSHGQHDFVLPLTGAIWLKEVLVGAKADLKFLQFSGGHEIPWEVLEEVGEFLQLRLTTEGS